MDAKFEEVFKYSLKAWWAEGEGEAAKTLEFIASSLMNIAHEKGWEDDVARVIEDCE